MNVFVNELFLLGYQVKVRFIKWFFETFAHTFLRLTPFINIYKFIYDNLFRNKQYHLRPDTINEYCSLFIDGLKSKNVHFNESC